MAQPSDSPGEGFESGAVTGAMVALFSSFPLRKKEQQSALTAQSPWSSGVYHGPAVGFLPSTNNTINIYNSAAWGVEGLHHLYIADPYDSSLTPLGRAGSFQSSGTQGTGTGTTGAPHYWSIDHTTAVGTITLPSSVSTLDFFNHFLNTRNAGFYFFWLNDCHTSIIITASYFSASIQWNANYKGRIGN